jgi:hypothetical protein
MKISGRIADVTAKIQTGAPPEHMCEVLLPVQPVGYLVIDVQINQDLMV